MVYELRDGDASEIDWRTMECRGLSFVIDFTRRSWRIQQINLAPPSRLCGISQTPIPSNSFLSSIKSAHTAFLLHHSASKASNYVCPKRSSF